MIGPFQTWLGEEHIHLKDFSAAERDFRAALISQPNNHFAIYGLGFCLRELGRHDESEKALIQAVSGNPDHVPSRLALANLYLKIDRYSDAIREYDTILTKDPENENIRINRDSAIEQRIKAEHAGKEDKAL